MWCVWFRLLSAGIVASVVACTPAAQRAPTPSADLTGVWIGKFTLGCVPPLASPRCLNRQDISFTFVEQDATVNVSRSPLHSSAARRESDADRRYSAYVADKGQNGRRSELHFWCHRAEEQ